MKVKQPYSVVCHLGKFIKEKKAWRIESGEPNYLEKEIIQELAYYCNIGFNQVVKIKHNSSQPSLRVALLISEFFDTKIEHLFEIRNKEV